MARLGGGIVFPCLSAVGAQPKGQIAQLIKTVALAIGQLVGRREIERLMEHVAGRCLRRTATSPTARGVVIDGDAFWVQGRDGLRVLDQLEIEVRRFQFDKTVRQTQSGWSAAATPLGLRRLRDRQQ